VLTLCAETCSRLEGGLGNDNSCGNRNEFLIAAANFLAVNSNAPWNIWGRQSRQGEE